MDIKAELASRFKELLTMEVKADAMYIETEKSLESEALKKFFHDLAEEEKGHAIIVHEMIRILEES